MHDTLGGGALQFRLSGLEGGFSGGLVASCDRFLDEPEDGVWGSDHFGVTAELTAFTAMGHSAPHPGDTRRVARMRTVEERVRVRAGQGAADDGSD